MWSTLPSGDTITFVPGHFYAVVASVKASHTRADLTAFAQGRGLQVFDYAEEGQREGLGPDPRAPDYKYIAAQALASSSDSVPWKVPWPASMFDSSSLVSAWQSAPAAVVPAPPAPPAPSVQQPASIALWPLAVLAAAGGGLSFYYGRRRRRRNTPCPLL